MAPFLLGERPLAPPVGPTSGRRHQGGLGAFMTRPMRPASRVVLVPEQVLLEPEIQGWLGTDCPWYLLKPVGHFLH